MTVTDEPIRLEESASDDVRSLLRDARAVPPMSADDRAAILAALAAPSGSGGGSPGASAASSKPLLAGLAVAVLGGAAVAIVLATRTSAPAVETRPPPVATTPATAVTTEPVAPSAPPAAPEASAAPEMSALPNRAPPRPSVAPRAVPSAAPEDTLGAESALVAKARANVDRDPAAALAALDEHARRFPNGELAPERDFLAIKALKREGRVDEARQRARAYATKHPSSPYAPAVQAILRELGAP